MKHEDKIPKRHTLPPQGAAPNCHLCRGWVGNTWCEVCHGTGYEPAVPPVPARDQDGRCTVCGLEWEDPREHEFHECPPGFGRAPVPAEPRSAKQFMETWKKENQALIRDGRWAYEFAEAYAATLREKLGAADALIPEHPNYSLLERLRVLVWNFKSRGERIEEFMKRWQDAEAALLSAQKEIERLRLALVQTMRAVEHIFDCEPEDQEGQAQGAVAVARAALAQEKR
jgi:hypothetical protein